MQSSKRRRDGGWSRTEERRFHSICTGDEAAEEGDFIQSAPATKQLRKVIMGAEENNAPASAPDRPHRLDLPHYPTFQGVANYPPPQPVIGFPQPVPPPGSADPVPPPRSPPYAPGHHTVPGFSVAESRPLKERRLRCFGLGCGWFLFISGFFLVGIPWIVAAVCLICNRHRMGDREKPGYIASVIAGIVAIIAIILGVTKATHAW